MFLSVFSIPWVVQSPLLSIDVQADVGSVPSTGCLGSVDSSTPLTACYDVISSGNIFVHYPALPGGPASSALGMIAKAENILTAAQVSIPRFLQFFGISEHSIDWPVRIFIVGDPGNQWNGLQVSCQHIYINVNAPNPMMTTAHEIFHCVQESLGMLEVGWEKWMIEGGATLGEHIAHPPSTYEHRRYPKYLQTAEVSLFHKSYDAGLMWFDLYSTSANSVSQQYLTYGSNTNHSTHAELLEDDWHKIALDLSNSQLVYDTNAGKIPQDSGPINLNSAKKVELLFSNYRARPWIVNLQPMSARYYEITIDGSISNKVNLMRFILGKNFDIDNNKVEFSAAIDGTPKEHTYFDSFDIGETEDGSKYFQICFKENTICEDDQNFLISDYYKSPKKIFLTISPFIFRLSCL